jgi:hypothetical protein
MYLSNWKIHLANALNMKCTYALNLKCTFRTERYIFQFERYISNFVRLPDVSFSSKDTCQNSWLEEYPSMDESLNVISDLICSKKMGRKCLMMSWWQFESPQ